MKMAIDDLAFAPDYLLIDAMQLDVPQPQESLIKGMHAPFRLQQPVLLQK